MKRRLIQSGAWWVAGVVAMPLAMTGCTAPDQPMPQKTRPVAVAKSQLPPPLAKAPGVSLVTAQAFARWKNDKSAPAATTNAKKALHGHLRSHRRLPAGLSLEEVEQLATHNLTTTAGARVGDIVNALRAAAAATVEPRAKKAGAAIETTALAALFAVIEDGRVPRGKRSAVIAQLSALEQVDRGKDRTDNATRRARRRMALYALRKIDRRMLPKVVDPYAAPKALLSKKADGKEFVYSLGPNAKDDGGNAPDDIVLRYSMPAR